MQEYSDEVIALAMRLGTSTLFEVSGMNNCALDRKIRSMWEGAVVAGSAYPVACAPGDNLGIQLALEKAPAGSILLQSQQTSGACSIAQHAALAALEGPKDFIDTSRTVFEKRRGMVVEMLNNAKGLSCETPPGAFYIFANCEALLGKKTPAGKLIECDKDVGNALLDEMNVAVLHGSAFGLGPYLRIAYAMDHESLNSACDRIQTFCALLSD